MDKTHQLKGRGVRTDNFKNPYAIHKSMLFEDKWIKKVKQIFLKSSYINILYASMRKKILTKLLANQIQWSMKRQCIITKWNFFPRMQGWFSIQKSSECNIVIV